MRKLVIPLALALLFLYPGHSDAQFVNPNWYQMLYPYGIYTPYFAPYPGPYFPPGVSYGHTPAESYARGMADLVRAQGQAEKNLSSARINNEIARSRYIENQVAWQQAYLQRKRAYQAYAAEERERSRQKYQNYMANRESEAPQPLTTSQVDFATGAVNWPTALQAPEYSEYRQRIEQLLQLEARTGGSASTEGELQQVARNMQTALKQNIRGIPANDYIAARNFLDSLIYYTRPAA